MLYILNNENLTPDPYWKYSDVARNVFTIPTEKKETKSYKH